MAANSNLFWYNLRRNWLVLLFAFLFVAGSAIFMFDQPEHDGFYEVTIVKAVEANHLQPENKKLIAEMDNGRIIILHNMRGVWPHIGDRAIVEKRTRSLMKYSEFIFIKYIDIKPSDKKEPEN